MASRIAVPFLLQGERHMVTVYCPQCGRKVGSHNGITKMNLAFNCKKCKKRILYAPVTAKVTVTKMLERTTSSGMRFV